MIRLVFLLTAALILLSHGSPSSKAADPDVDNLIKQVRERSSDYDKLTKLLSDESQSVKLAAFDTMVDSGNDSLFKMAVDHGLESDDAAVRSRALKAIVFSMNSIQVQVDPSDLTEDERKYLMNALSFSFFSKLNKENCINLDRKKEFCWPDRNLTVSGQTVTIAYKYNAGLRWGGTFRLDSSRRLRGDFYHSRLTRPIAAFIDLY